MIDILKRGMPPACACILAFLLAFLSASALAMGGDFPVRNTRGAIAIAKKVCGPLFLPSYVWKVEYSGGSWHARAISRDNGQVLFFVDIPVKGPATTCYQAATED